MADLNKMYAILLQQEQNPMPQVVLVSVDPANDTLEKLGNYVASYNPHFQGATGDKAEIDKLAASLNILVTQTPMGQKVGAQAIDHSGAILLIDPTGKLIAVFSLPHDPAAMARDFELIVKNSG
jgi:protein SCO1/2